MSMFNTTVGRLAGGAPVLLHTVCEQAESSLSCIKQLLQQISCPKNWCLKHKLVTSMHSLMMHVFCTCVCHVIPELPKHLSDSHCLNAT